MGEKARRSRHERKRTSEALAGRLREPALAGARAIVLLLVFILLPAFILNYSLGELKAAKWNMYGELSAGIGGAASQLSVTLPALAGTTVGLLALLAIGSTLSIKFAGGKNFGFPELLLASFVLGALATYPLLLALGALKLYSILTLSLATLAVTAYAFTQGIIGQMLSRAREFLSGAPRIFADETGFILLFALIFGGIPCLLLQLASPVPPFMDVAPNHFAPVEQVLTFHEYHPEGNNPSPEYGMSRIFPGYVSVFSFIATFSGASAAHAISAFAAFLFILQITAAYAIGKNIFGKKAGAWATAFLLLSFAQLRGNDVRATGMVFVFIAAAFAFHSLYSNKKTGILLPASALSLALLFHPMLGGFALLSLAAISLSHLASGNMVRFAADLQIYSLALIPFIYAMIPLTAAYFPAACSWAAILALSATAFILSKNSSNPAPARIASGATGALAALMAALLAYQMRAGETAFSTSVREYPAIAFPGLMGIALAAFLSCKTANESNENGPDSSDSPAFALALALPALAAFTFMPLLPATTGEISSVLNELPAKSTIAWPTFALIFPAGFLASSLTGFLASAKGALSIPGKIASAAVALALLSILIHPFLGIRESGADTISQQWASHALEAARGYYQGWWDTREMIGPEQEWICDYLKGEARAGRLEYGTLVLQYSAEAFNWMEYPIAPFSGATVALVSDRAEPDNPHLQGSRRTWVAHWGELVSGKPGYILIQKARGPDYPGYLPEAGEGYSLVNETAQFALYRRTYK